MFVRFNDVALRAFEILFNSLPHWRRAAHRSLSLTLSAVFEFLYYFYSQNTRLFLVTVHFICFDPTFSPLFLFSISLVLHMHSLFFSIRLILVAFS